MANKTTKKIELSLIKEIEEFYLDIFRQDDPRRDFDVPDYISNNLKHKLRNYQASALRSLNYTQKDVNANSRFNQLLFHMATGSGKTDIMAGVMLYMYAELGVQNFLFVVNTNSVIAKTKENLLNSSSNKYLFTPNMMVNNERLDIREVTTFPNNPESGVMYLRLATIQTLSNELGSYRENGLTYEDLSKHPLVILADEAHHFSAQTKSVEKQEKAWENVLDRVRQANPANRQFEFTATIDLQNENIRNKYADKIVAQYELSLFVSDGYSKNVRYLQANGDDKSKMLNAVLLSQYRKMIAKQAGIKDFKPVILFKSNKVDISKSTRDNFLDMIEHLTVEELQEFIDKAIQSNVTNILPKVYGFYSKMNLSELIVELQNDFSARHIINVNDTTSDGIFGDLNNQKNLNTLEEPDNPFRAIFAVAKLSEGWDVLNLYDIVRISEGADGSTAVSRKATNSEAQLIGRGARYYPFEFENQKSFTRRFDGSDSDLQILEYLDYHTINEPSYLENLKKSFDEMDLPVEDDTDYNVFSTKVKESFKKTEVYKNGKLYYNTVEEIPKEDWDSLSKYGIKIADLPEVDISSGITESDGRSEGVQARTRVETLELSHDNEILLKKAIAKNKFYRFSNIVQYLPNLKSMQDFRESGDWLGAIPEILVRLSDGDELTREKELLAVEKYLEYIQRQIIMNYKKQRGTNRFISIPMSDMVKDYEKKVSVNLNNANGAIILPHDMKGENKKWFPHENAIVDILEYHFIELLQSYVEQLKEKYDDVYLIRNDERLTTFKLHDFGENITSYAGFMPDFILYLGSTEEIIQVYIEPKGTAFVEQDRWKEDLLEKINNSEILIEDENVKLIGLKFYTGDNGGAIRDELFERIR
ncbi:MAG: DEAD/DEAH box helicase family protein [Streptococcaceae bacterium]|nr:DEAD/DEAH box helicase family protein [Streptococcaceae bacterium]